MNKLGHVHRSRVITNSQFKNHQIHDLLNLSPKAVKCLFYVSKSACDGRMYSQVVSTKCDTPFSDIHDKHKDTSGHWDNTGHIAPINEHSKDCAVLNTCGNPYIACCDRRGRGVDSNTKVGVKMNLGDSTVTNKSNSTGHTVRNSSLQGNLASAEHLLHSSKNGIEKNRYHDISVVNRFQILADFDADDQDVQVNHETDLACVNKQVPITIVSADSSCPSGARVRTQTDTVQRNYSNIHDMNPRTVHVEHEMHPSVLVNQVGNTITHVGDSWSSGSVVRTSVDRVPNKCTNTHNTLEAVVQGSSLDAHFSDYEQNNGLCSDNSTDSNNSVQDQVIDNKLSIWCQEFLNCNQQIGTAFGCVLMSPIRVYAGSKVVRDEIPDIITAHNMVKTGGIPNLLQCGIPVDTNLNVAAWRSYLSDYFDQQLPDLIEFGFPLDFDRKPLMIFS